MQAKLSHYHQTPRKVRAVANLVRGRTVKQAIAELNFLPQKAAGPLVKLLKSATKNAGGDENLIIKSLTVEKGMVFKRYYPVARGGVHPRRRRTSTIRVTLVPQSQ